jgi:Caspase domain/WD domain, G-beta repeat
VDETRSALIVASDRYTDPGLRRLRAPASDARALAAVLRDPGIGGFGVRTVLNEPAHVVTLAVEEFFADRRPSDLLLMHFSGHGVKDEDGELYFAASNTVLGRLGATAVAAEFVSRRMNRSRSRRVVLLLDCCYAGAFERGLAARAGTDMGIEHQFGGRGRAVITASSAMEYAFEAGELADSREMPPSVFTSALVQGLETGDADRDQDGLVGLDELYDYVYDKVRAVTPNQTPGKWTFGMEGELYIARRSHPVTTPAPLPPELVQAIDSPLAGIRAGAVQELAAVLRGRHAGMALAARLALERLTDDDSRAVAAAATATLSVPVLPPASMTVAADPEPGSELHMEAPSDQQQVAALAEPSPGPAGAEPLSAATTPAPASAADGPVVGPTADLIPSPADAQHSLVSQGGDDRPLVTDVPQPTPGEETPQTLKTLFRRGVPRPLLISFGAVIAFAGVLIGLSLATGGGGGGQPTPPGTHPPSSQPTSRQAVSGPATGSFAAVLKNPKYLVTSVAFGPGGTLAVGGQNAGLSKGAIYVWDLATGKVIDTLTDPGSEGVDAVAFAPGGTILAAGDFNGSTYLWDLATSKITATLRDPAGAGSGVNAVAFAPGGKTLAVGDTNDITYVWDLATKNMTAIFNGPSSDEVNALAFAPGGKTLAVGSGDYNQSEGATSVRDLATRKTIAILTDPGSNGVKALAFAPGGKTLAVGDINGHTYLWDFATRKITATLTDPGSAGVLAMALAPGRTTLAIGDNNGSTYLWDLATKKLTATLDHRGHQVEAVAFSPGGTTLASGDSNGSTYLWDIKFHSS